jgi:hypothetical protein
MGDSGSKLESESEMSETGERYIGFGSHPEPGLRGVCEADW